MTTLQVLYAQDPFWVWFGLAGLLLGLALASGLALPLAPALGAAAVGLLELSGLRLGPIFETALTILVAGMAIGARLALAAASAQAQAADPIAPAARATDLVGRIGRTTGEFVNGVGRVWLDGAEWSAELDQGADDSAPPNIPVRVTRVIGGAKLQVQTLVDGR